MIEAKEGREINKDTLEGRKKEGQRSRDKVRK